MEMHLVLVRNLLRELQRTLEDGINLQRLDVLTTMAERVLRAFVMVMDAECDQYVSTLQEMVDQLNRMSSLLQEDQNSEQCGYFPAVVFSGRRGRPKISVTVEMLDYFFSHGFSATTTAMLLQVSLSTIRRRMLECGMRIRDCYSALTDSELDRIVTVIQHSNPNCGYRMMQGYLIRMGHRVQQNRVRESMTRTDPEGVISRWCNAVRRRCYSVSSPNALWHIDGHHRLIRWRLVTHAGIDGYSRLPVYCQCSDNNRSDTVLELFRNAVENCGLPSRVRCDRGTENYGVGYYMLNHPQRGSGRGSIITGQSVHNQRIERFWRDIFVGCIAVFYHLFYHLEDCGFLDATNSLDLFCLHFVYKPYINYALKLFIEAWSSHPLRSVGNKTPTQLWIEGMMVNASSGNIVTDELYGENNFETYGIDWDGPISVLDSEEGIEVPGTNSPISEGDLHFLKLLYTQEAILASDCHAVDVYIHIRSFVYLHYGR